MTSDLQMVLTVQMQILYKHKYKKLFGKGARSVAFGIKP